MKKIQIIQTFLAALIFMSHCSTTTNVNVLKPAELNVGAVKKIAVLDFDFTGSWDFSGAVSTPKDLRGAGQLILAKVLNNEADPDPIKAYPGIGVSDMLVAKLVNNGYYTVIERKELAKILEEQALGLSGVIDAGQAAEIGKLLGAEGLIMGAGTYHVKDEGEWETYKEKNEEKKRYKIGRYVDAQFTYKIVNVTTGEIIASQTNSASNYSRGALGSKRLASKYVAKAADELKARKGIPDWRPIVGDMVNRTLDQTVRQIAPHYVVERRKIEEGESAPMEAATEYAKRGLWEDAKGVWESVVQDNSVDIEDRIAATYNLGLYYEIYGQLDTAEQLFDKVFKMSGDTKYLDAKVRIQNRRRELERLKRQQTK
jgi:curli biogenesis system outer membrane secretion channel CsgG